ncbi:mitochondrial import inner membrane translocase subunit Tim8-like [Tribolium castaneum]|uniref:mitochondrial import inner membrane translocase subunit Tim8-like n=1 Tax=Tribolium castaneum TaxID=7070 RepID=UPI00077DB83E|nr:PREDICTED: mitochondrial import inner membrane translocase subunit Tim8-like [Tribolium castaneum]|eukprot:XP_015833017.1 PREDICTED: mitochondrial import inner membrane translocase subunit Tim8-like [Tribolium castaneum]
MSEENSVKQLQDILVAEREIAEIAEQIHEFNELCWDKCVYNVGKKLDSKTETCLTNCVNRFIDVSFLITNRFAQLLEKRINNV